MAHSYIKIFTWVLLGMLLPNLVVSDCKWYPPVLSQQPNLKFEQKVDRFWIFKDESKRWSEISLPFDLTSCINDSCSKVGSIDRIKKEQAKLSSLRKNKAEVTNEDMFMPLRNRVSLTKITEASLWVTAQSGTIYERFWNGAQWVIALHELPKAAGPANSIFFVNQTILARSEAGILYKLQLNENGMPIWVELKLNAETKIQGADTRSSSETIMSGVISPDGEKLYLSGTSGSLLELNELQPLRWSNLGRPPGADVASIADAASLRTGVVFTVSSSGELYEFDRSSKPSWKKHIWGESSEETISLNSRGCTCHGFAGPQSKSLFLLTKNGSLLERRLQQRKWKWIAHGHPDGHSLSAITSVERDEANEETTSMFCTTSTGSVFGYQLSKHPGQEISAEWVNHAHPQHAKVARGIQGVQLQFGRIIFPLDDGRLGELHLSSIGGTGPGPVHQVSMRRKVKRSYEWSILEAPETEGWNAEHCTENNGPANCIEGTKVTLNHDDTYKTGGTTSTRRWKVQEQQYYLSPPTQGAEMAESSDTKNYFTTSINKIFHMRTMQEEKSLFLVTDSGLTFECMYNGNIWLWLRHEYTMPMVGILGNYNGSMYMVDTDGNLLVRERKGNELSWINITSMRRGKQVASGAPWDSMPREDWRTTAEDALFFINKKGRLLQLTVALRKFKWKDCKNPPNMRIAMIVDQEILRMNIVFVVGRNGRLYQYNRVNELWHEHYQSPHLILSRTPGTAMRPSALSLTGSLFMILESGGLAEYYWNTIEGWNWVEHGTPKRDITLVGAPGPCYIDRQLFLVGSDGHVYRRYLERGLWKWSSHKYPHSAGNIASTVHMKIKNNENKLELEYDLGDTNGISRCDEMVAAVRPTAFSDRSVMFELRDGRLAELRRAEEDAEWEWQPIIGAPTSTCFMDYWTALAS